MRTEVNNHEEQTGTNPNPLFHRLDISGNRIPYPQEGLGDNKTISIDLFLELQAPQHGLFTKWLLYLVSSLPENIHKLVLQEQ